MSRREDRFTNTPEDAALYEARREQDNYDEDYGEGPQEPRREVEPEPRSCPECEQGKHQGCDNLALDCDDRLVPCPCATRRHR